MIRQFKSAGKYSILIPAFVMAHRNLARTYEAKGLYSESVEESLEAAALEGRTPVQVADARRAFAETRVVGFWRTFVRQEKASAEGDPYRIAE